MNDVVHKGTKSILSKRLCAIVIVGLMISTAFSMTLLSNTTSKEHDIAVRDLETPLYTRPNEMANISANIKNVGLNDEANIIVNLTVNGMLVNGTTIDYIPSGAAEPVWFWWSESIEGTYKVGIWVEPVQWENITDNNLQVNDVVVTSGPAEGTVGLISDENELQRIRKIVWNVNIPYEELCENNQNKYTENLSKLIEYDTIVYYTSYDMGYDEYDVLEAYLEVGGNLLVTGYDSLGGKSPIADLVRSTRYGLGPSNTDFDVTDFSHPMMDGLYAKYGSNDNPFTPVSEDHSKAKANTSAGAETVAELKDTDTNDMIISTDLESGGNVLYWNSDAVNDWREDENFTNMFKNYLDWYVFGEQDYDAAVNDLESPGFSLPDEQHQINATIWNRGEYNIVKPFIELVQNDTEGGWEQIDSYNLAGTLSSKTSEDVIFTWTAPSAKTEYTIGIRVTCTETENITTNNLMKKDCRVATSPKEGKVGVFSDLDQLNHIIYMLDDMNLSYDIYTDNMHQFYIEDISLLFDYQTILFYNLKRFITEEEHEALKAYTRHNGSLLVTGIYCMTPDNKDGDDLLADVLNVTCDGEQRYSDSLLVNESSHPIMNGPYGVFQKNYTRVGLDPLVSDVEAKNGTVTVADYGGERKYDKITSLNHSGKAVFWNGDGPKDWITDPDCEAMFRNFLDWSMFIIKEDHDIWVTNFKAPSRLLPGASEYINATIRNRGKCDEENITINLTVDGVIEDSTTIQWLNSTEMTNVSFSWSQEEDGNYTVAIEAEPVNWENSTENNHQSTTIKIYHPIAYILVDFGHESYAKHNRFFTDLIYKDYWINYTLDPLTEPFLSNHNAMIVIGASKYYSDDEITSIKLWLKSGHGLLVIGGEKEVVNNLTEYAWIDWNGPYPYGSGATTYINHHPITEGVETFYYAQSTTSLLVSGHADDVVYDEYNETIQCAATSYYRGKIVAIAARECLYDAAIELNDSKIFERNVMNWLIEPAERHTNDIAVTDITASEYMIPFQTYCINGTVENTGLENEINVGVNLKVNGAIEDTITVNLNINESVDVSFEWIVPGVGNYPLAINVTAVQNETNLEDNELNKIIRAFNPNGFILVDDGHSETNDYSGYYEDLWDQDYWLNHTTEGITSSILDGYDIFFTINPETAHSSSEINAIKSFVNNGGGELVVGHYSKINCHNLTSWAGIRWWDKSADKGGSTEYIVDYTITFGANELIYAGGLSYLSLKTSRVLVRDLEDNYVQAGTGTYGDGRVVALVCYDWFKGYYFYAYDNRQFGRNIANWLGKNEDDHDVGIDELKTPTVKDTDSGNYYDSSNTEDVKIKAKVHNLGLNTESNFYVNFTVNGEVEQSEYITDPLNPDEAIPIEFQWRPSTDGDYTVGIEAEQLPGEDNITNNKLEKNITVFTPKAYVLVDEGHENDNLHDEFYADIMSQGYWVNHTSATLNIALLNNYQILISSGASSDFSNKEETDIRTFVENGGGLLAIADDKSIYAELTDYAGITWEGPRSWGGETTTFIDPHPTTNNTKILNPSTSGLSIEIEDPAQAIVFDDEHATIKGAVSQYDNGKIVALVYSRWLSYHNFDINDNKQFGRNIVSWFTEDKTSHDIGLTNLQITRALTNLQITTYIIPNEIVYIEASIINNGANEETDIVVNLTVNGTVVDGTDISNLGGGTSINVEFSWTAPADNYVNYTFGISSEPQTGEIYLANNNLTRNVTARYEIAKVLFDLTHDTESIRRFKKWTNRLEYLGYIIGENHDEITWETFQGYDSFVIPQPTLHYEKSARLNITNFVSSGGGLFVIGDDEADICSKLTGFAGLNWSYGGAPCTTIHIEFHEITTDVASIYLQSPMARLEIDSYCSMLIKDDENDTMLATSENPGRVACFVDESSFLDENIDNADNMMLATNMIEWVSGAPPQITSVAHDVNKTISTNYTFNVTLVGERRQIASFDVGIATFGIPLYDDGEHNDGEADDGIYCGNYTVKDGDDGSQTITGHLYDGLTNSSMDATPDIEIDTASPDIENVTHDATGTLTTNDLLYVELIGEEGLSASFNLINFTTSEKLYPEDITLPENEFNPGEYYNTTTIQENNDGTWTVVGYLDDDATPRTSKDVTPDVIIDTIEPWIDNVTHDATETLTTNDLLTVILVGEPGLTAKFDVGNKATEQPMNETETPGTYEGTYTVKDGDDGKHTIKGYLDDGVTARNFKCAAEQVDIDTVQPVINSVTHDAANKNLTSGDVITVWLESGETDLSATFDIGTIAISIPMYDDGAHNDGAANDGNYSSNYTIVKGKDDGVWIVTGYLDDGATPPASQSATENVSIDTYVEGARNLRVELGGSSLQHINLTWDRSLDDGIGDNDVVNYTIYRAKGWFDREYIVMEYIEAIGSSTYNWSDEGVGEGDPNNYFYYIEVLDSNQHKNVSQKGGKFIRNLPTGKQLFSIPLEQSDTDITEVLRTIEGNYNDVQWYDPLDAEDHWKTYDSDKPSGYNDLLAIDHKMALWVTMTSTDDLVVTGKVPYDFQAKAYRVQIQLYKGWNLISYASFINRTVSNALEGLPYDQVEGYADLPPYYLMILTDSNMMIPGCGYWIHMTEDRSWTVDNENEPSEPTIDYIVIEDVNGDEILDQSVDVGYTITGYARAYNYTNGYIGSVSVMWSLTNEGGAEASTDPFAGTSSTFDAGLKGGTATWTADDGAGHKDTVVYTIRDPTVDWIIIEYYNGTEIGDVAMTADEFLDCYARGYNITAGPIGGVDATWSVTGGIGTVSPITGNMTTFDATTVGTGTIHADDGNHTDDTGTITVSHGACVSIDVTPNTWSGTADEAQDFDATASDADGNTWDTDAGTWTTTDPWGTVNATGYYEAGQVGEWKVKFTHTASGQFDESTITVSAGALNYIRIENLDGTEIGDISMIVGNARDMYSRGYDSDGNLIGDVSVTWSSSNETVGTVDPTTGTNTTFSALADGTCYVSADDGASHTDTTGTITVTSSKASEESESDRNTYGGVSAEGEKSMADGEERQSFEPSVGDRYAKYYIII